MMRRSLKRVAVAATGVFLLCGGSSLRAAEAASAGLPPFVAAEPSLIFDRATAGAVAEAAAGGAVSSPLIGIESGEAIAANASDGVAAIPLPPSAYPGMVGLATAALSVWRYRRRRR